MVRWTAEVEALHLLVFQRMSWTGLCPRATRRSRPTGYEYMPTEPGKSSDQMGYEQLCTRWNREEAEAVQRCKRTLQSDETSHEASSSALSKHERARGQDLSTERAGVLGHEVWLLGSGRHVPGVAAMTQKSSSSAC